MQFQKKHRLIISTTTPDNTFPSTATLVQKTDIDAVSFDVQAVCAGFVFALSIAKSMMIEGNYKNLLIAQILCQNY